MPVQTEEVLYAITNVKYILDKILIFFTVRELPKIESIFVK